MGDRSAPEGLAEELPAILPDVIGTAGGLLIVGAYFLLQIGRLDPRSLAYSLVNAVGAGLILFSLWFDFNLGAAFVETFWLAVSLFGIAKGLRRSSPEPGPSPGPPKGDESAENA